MRATGLTLGLTRNRRRVFPEGVIFPHCHPIIDKSFHATNTEQDNGHKKTAFLTGAGSR